MQVDSRTIDINSLFQLRNRFNNVQCFADLVPVAVRELLA